MRLTSNDIDEYTLAAYLAGKLAPRRRREVARMLAESEDARELVVAARDLLDLQGDGAARRLGTDSDDDSVFSGERLRLAFLYAAIGVLLVAVVATTMMTLRIRADVAAKHASPPLENPSWNVGLAVRSGFIEWEGVPGAAYYRLVFWNPEQGAPAFETDVTDIRFDLGSAPEAIGHASHSVWVEAIGQDGRAMRRARSIPLWKVD